MLSLPAPELLILSVVQTATVYCFILIGLKIVGSMVDIEDLNEVAREQGSLSYEDFSSMVLEGDG